MHLVDESPEEILARLVRHRDALARVPRPAPFRPVAVVPEHVAPVVWFPKGRTRWPLSAVESTLIGQILATVAGALGILAFERFATNIAVLVVAAMTAVGVLAAARRIPLSLWWTLGAVIGGTLGHWS